MIDSTKIRVVWHTGEVIESTRMGGVRALFMASELIHARSDQSVPKQEGILELSGATSVDEQALEATVFYDTPYAVRQHEDLQYSHAPGRRAKYLQLALEENEGRARAIFEQQLRSAL